jgi:hypothetical protein
MFSPLPFFSFLFFFLASNCQLRMLAENFGQFWSKNARAGFNFPAQSLTTGWASFGCDEVGFGCSQGAADVPWSA